jgi:hypothetical protein
VWAVAHATEALPPGNNGTVKIDGAPFDDQPNNEPHPGCVFQVDFYGFDQGNDLFATVTFEALPPTVPDGDRVLLTDTVFIGEDDSSGGGSEAGLDASQTYSLDFPGIEPQPQQGFHVKLTVNAEGSQGADIKHKAYWVTGCATPTPTTRTTTSTPTPSTTATTKASTTTTATSTTATTTTTRASTTSNTTSAPSSSTTSSPSVPVSTVTTYSLQPVNAGAQSDSGNAGTLATRGALLVAALLSLLVLVSGRWLPKDAAAEARRVSARLTNAAPTARIPPVTPGPSGTRLP